MSSIDSSVLSLFGVSSSTASAGSGFPGGSIAYYNYLAKSGTQLQTQSNNSPQVAKEVAYFQSRVAVTTPAQATTLVKLNANLPSTDPAGTIHTINVTAFDSSGGKWSIKVNLTKLASNLWSAQAVGITDATPISPTHSTPSTGLVTSVGQTINFNPTTGLAIPVSVTNPATGQVTNNAPYSLGSFKLSNGATLSPVFSLSGGGATNGQLSQNGAVYSVTSVQGNGNAQVAGPNTIKSVNDLFKDPRLLNFLLTANGLGDQTQNVGLVKKALTQNPSQASALVNHLSNTKFKSADQLLQLYNGLSTLQNPSTMQALINNYQQNTFEQGIAKTDPAVAQARYFARNVANAVSSATTTTNAAYAILGDSVLRTVVTTALGLPAQGFASLPIQDQASIILAKGNIQQFKNPTAVAHFVTRYLVQAQLQSSSDGGSSDAALSILG